MATRIAFLLAGFSISCWAPLVPFAKVRLGVDDAVLGLLLLCIGAGSVPAMLATGPISARHGTRPVIVVSGIGLAASLPLLTIASTPLTLGAVLLLFGAALGSLDVAMNIHAVEVERAAGRPILSGFHALYSVGGFVGSGLMTSALSLQVGTTEAAVVCAALVLSGTLVAWPRLLDRQGGGGEQPVLALPQGVVLVLAGLAAAMFLVEGAMLDWGALLLTETGLATRAQSGIGYILFSIAMAGGRFLGDRVVARIGDRATILSGGGLMLGGFIVLLAVPAPVLALSGFLWIGAGASNIVPILFRRAGSQTFMPPALAIAAVTTSGYIGLLVGPAAVGFVAETAGLEGAFWMLAALGSLVLVFARKAAPEASDDTRGSTARAGAGGGGE